MAINTSNTYTVDKGDTLINIARRLGITSDDPKVQPWQVLGRLNGINTLDEAKLIQPKQKLTLPEGITVAQTVQQARPEEQIPQVEQSDKATIEQSTSKIQIQPLIQADTIANFFNAKAKTEQTITEVQPIAPTVAANPSDDSFEAAIRRENSLKLEQKALYREIARKYTQQIAQTSEQPAPKQPSSNIQQPIIKASKITDFLGNKAKTEQTITTAMPADPANIQPSNTEVKITPENTEAHAIIIDKLIQETPLNFNDIGSLQKALKDAGNSTVKVDGIKGKNTCAGIVDFLKSENSKGVIVQLGAPALAIIDKYNQDPAFNRLLAQEGIPATHVVELEYIINNYLEKNVTPNGDNKDLLVSLNALGYDIKGLEKTEKINSITDLHKDDRNTVYGALAEYVKDHPEAFKTTDPVAHYRYFALAGHSDMVNQLVKSTGLLEERQRLVIETIPLAAEATSVNPEVAKSKWLIESNGDEALASGTGCEGSQHFNDPTWLLMMTRHGDEIAQLIRQNHPSEEYEKIAADIEAKRLETNNKDGSSALAGYQYHPVVSTYTSFFLDADNAKSLHIDPALKRNKEELFLSHNAGSPFAKETIALARNNDPRPLMIALKTSDNYEIYKDVARNNPGIYIKDYTASQVMGLIGELQKTKSNEYYSRFGHIERSITQEKLPNTELASHRECVESYLENGRTPSGNNTDLLVSLDTMGYNIKDLNTYREKEVSNALTNYISDNPKMMLTASTSRLKDMIDHGQSRELQTIAQKVDGFDDLIAQKLKEIGNIKEAGKPEVTELQTLLSLSGYSTGNINGIAAKRTIDDIYEYKLDSGIIKKPAFSVAVFFKDAAETPQIGTTRVSAHNKYYDEHTNGFGVSQMAIERVWAGLTGNDIQDKGTTPEDSAANNPRPLVMIDLGHGADIHWINERTGKHHHSLELGKGVNDKINFTEAHIVDPLGQALAEKLHRQGYQVAFTRNPGEQLRIEGGHKTTLEARSLFAHEMNKELGANGTIFISLHANAAKNHKTNGTEIYAQQGKHGKGYQNEKSLELAKSVGKNFSIDNKEAQIKHDDFRVLHEFERGASDEKLHASILIETGYITDNKDLKALRKIAEEPDVAAANIAQGVDMFVQENVPELQIAAEAKKSTNCHEIKGGMIDCKINNPSAGQNINL